LRVEETVERLSKGAKTSVENEVALDIAWLDAVEGLASCYAPTLVSKSIPQLDPMIEFVKSKFSEIKFKASLTCLR
jgi:hypothetical protein